jgi:hypothetical protein
MRKEKKLAWNPPFKALTVSALSLAVLVSADIIAQCEPALQRIAIIRHGEKPTKAKHGADIGQLNCKGLNRALALAPVIDKAFGRPNFIFAPNPSHADTKTDKPDDVEQHGYIRALATVEPLAIEFGLPVDASIDVADKAGLESAIEKILSIHPEVLILVAWEHHRIPKIVRNLLKAHGADQETVNSVDDWEGTDFDSIYVVTIDVNDKAVKATFEHRQESLDDQPDACQRGAHTTN